MDESEDNMSSEDLKTTDSPFLAKSKPKKRSLVERELETSLTARVTSPVTNGDGSSTSRYGRARRLKSDNDFCETEKAMTKIMKSPKFEKSPVKIQSPVYKMHASNSPIRTESKKARSIETNIENQIENIYNENIALSRFGSEEMKSSSPAKKFTKVYVRKDLIQKKEKEETITLIKNMFSPIKSTYKSTNTHLNNILERSSEKYGLDSSINLKQNGHLTPPSVVKTLDFDGSKKKKDIKENKTIISKSELFDWEAKCEYQVGDLAWARVGTYPFWPCIVTRDPLSGMFVKKKLFGRVVRDVLHVTFFGDNGRRGWIVENMLRAYLGQLEFETAREKFTSEAKKRDPRLYAAFFISEKKQPQWNVSVEEAEMLLREPKRLRIDMLNDMLEKFRSAKSTPKRERGGKITRTDSDVSLSESLYDSLFSEDDGKSDDYERSRSKSRNKSLDVSEVVTACLDNMAAKTGITKIQRQSHMDRWLQKAKSKTPEKSQPKAQVNIQRAEKESKVKNPKKKKKSPKVVQTNTLYSFRKFITESRTTLDNNMSSHQNEHDYSSQNSQDSESLSFTADETDSTAENESIQEIPTEKSVEDTVSNNAESLSNVVESKEEDNCTNNQEDVIMAVVNEDIVEVGSATVDEVLDENTTRESVNEVTENESNKVFEEMDVNQSIENNVLTDEEEYAHLDFIMSSNNVDTNINNTVTPDIEDIQGQNYNENQEISDNVSDNCITEKCSRENDSLCNDDVANDESQANNTNLLDAEKLDTENNDTGLNDLKDIDSKQTELNDNCIDKNDNLNCELFESNNNSEIEDTELKEVLSEEKKKIENSTDDETVGDSNEKEQIKNCDTTDDVEKEIIHSNDIISEKNENKNKSTELKQNDMEKHIHPDDAKVNMEMNEQFQSNNLIVSEKFVDGSTEPKQNDLEEHLLQDDEIKEADNEDLSKDNATADKLEETDQLNEQDNKTVNGDDKLCCLENSSDHTSEPVENGFHENKENTPEMKFKEEFDPETASINSEDSEVSITKRRLRSKNGRLDVKKLDKLNTVKALQEPEFVKYMEFRQDALIEENPELTQDDIVAYLYKTWLYEEGLKSDRKKTDDIEQLSLVKGLSHEIAPQPKKYRKKIKVEKEPISEVDESVHKDKPKRKTVKPYYNEDYSDIEEELEYFEIFRKKNKETAPKVKIELEKLVMEQVDVNEVQSPEEVDEEEIYFEELTKLKPNLFKGLVREKVCEICEKTGNLVKCKGCNSMFHVDCVKKEVEVIDVPVPTRGRKKKKKPRGRKPKGFEESNGEYESQSDEKSQDMNSEDINMSVDEIEPESHIVADADNFEAQISAKMREMLENTDAIEYESLSSDDELDWSDTVVGKCKIVDVKLKSKNRNVVDNDYSDFKCNNCQKNDTPLCFVCKSAFSPKSKSERRQRCQVPHCHKYYHMECLEHWPQTQFSSGEPSRNNKKINEHFEALTCPRHVCHTCVCDDPRGCKTRFSGDKLARCVKCPATYHSFTKCLPAGTQILTGSHIICPRHYEHRPGKVPCHVNTGWCFICALGGTLICCEYCPTSFHAECLNIKPPEGGYMCEDCETGRLPLYGEMVWVKLGHYRWWPGIILHPSEIPDNILAVKHSPGEFVVRFFGQYDHYWVNRGRVFPFQEGDSGKISSQKSKIDAAFTKAMEHAQRACEILKSVEPNQEESLDIASSLLPPHYVKLKVNKPCGSLCGRRGDLEANSHTQCECDPREEDPCGHNTQCLNRMLLTECGPTCKAGDRCNNRAFEKRLYPKLVPYRTPHRGWGLKTLEDIKKGQFVIEYVGELIDEEEFKRRMRRKHEVRDENFYFLTLDKERMIDAGPKGNLARFMNHCCEPNCETQKWTVLGDVRVGLFAINDIPANSELTFNYNLECAGIDKKRCLCGAKRCSGYIGAKPKQEESQPKKGKVAAKRTYKKRKNTDESPSVNKCKPKSRQTTRSVKPRELTDIEKDLLIIKNATNGMSSDSECSGRLSSMESEKNQKALKRKRVSFSTEEIIIYNGSSSPSVKKLKLDYEICSSGVGD